MKAMERTNSQSIDSSDEEESYEEEKEEIVDEVKLLKMLVKASYRTKFEDPMYEGNLNFEELVRIL